MASNGEKVEWPDILFAKFTIDLFGRCPKLIENSPLTKKRPSKFDPQNISCNAIRLRDNDSVFEI